MSAVTRPRLPAYARELIARRQAREPIIRVAVLVGHDWSRPTIDVPIVAVGVDWRPGSIVWECLAGLAATILPRGGIDPLPVAAEIADWCAPCDIEYARPEDISDLAFGARMCVADPPRFVWPSWRNDEREASYIRRRGAWWRREALAGLAIIQGGRTDAA